MEAEKMELRLINPNESGFLQHIEWNSDEIRSQVEVMMSAYTDVVYTDDTMKSAKEDRATLNKVKKAIEDRRKEVKRRCMEPYEQFEKEVKDIVALIDEPILMIDGQIKEYEEKLKQEKKERIQEAYNEVIGDLSGTLPFEKVFDTRYLNATYAASKAVAEIKGKIEVVRTDLATIDGLNSTHKLNVRDVYMRTFDLSKAMAEDRRLRELEEKLEAERREKEEAEKKRLEAEAAKREEMERQKKETQAHNTEGQLVTEMGKAIAAIEHQVTQQATQEPEKKQEEKIAQEQNNTPEPKRYKAEFWCKGTLEQIKALGDFMRANNIEFGKVAK